MVTSAAEPTVCCGQVTAFEASRAIGRVEDRLTLLQAMHNPGKPVPKILVSVECPHSRNAPVVVAEHIQDPELVG